MCSIKDWSRIRRCGIRMVLGAALFACCSTVEAGWIDPDTPKSAYTTRPISVKAPPKDPPQTKEDKKDTDKRNNRPTPAPTYSAAPTQSHAPSQSPSSSPTLFPTFYPDRVFELVFSDEFNVDQREFRDGTDPRWTALDKNDYTNDALHYYSPENVQTFNGSLIITSQASDTDIIGFDDVQRKRTHVTKHFKSAMVQSWNKFCLTGGILEARVQLPGHSTTGGLWPAFWMLGNLARHTYVGSSEHIWPWSSSACIKSEMRAQQISGCDRVSHYSMMHRLGRGAPEMDIFEVQPGNIRANTGPFLKSSVGQPFMSASYQVAPGRRANRPGPGEWPGPDQWYSHLMGGKNTSMNILFYGTYNHFRDDVNEAAQDYWSDAISFNRQLNESYFTKPHTYRLEWDVPSNTSMGYLHWFLDGELVLSLDGRGLNGTGAEISSEPSYILLNTAISKQWGFPKTCPENCPCEKYNCNSPRWQEFCGFSPGFCEMMKKERPQYKIDWIRAYQDPNDEKQKVGCSTPERPTRKYIVAHEKSYKQETDERPLKGVARGLGSCLPDATSGRDACGGLERGRCTLGKVCECQSGWTGPHCLAHRGYNDIEYDEPDRITDVGFVPPLVAPTTLLWGLIVLLLLLLLSSLNRSKLSDFSPIPDVDKRRPIERRQVEARRDSRSQPFQSQRQARYQYKSIDM